MFAEPSAAFRSLKLSVCLDRTQRSKAWGPTELPPVQVDSSSFAGMDHWAPSAAIAEVEVDPDTGEFEVLKFAVAVDAGEMLHYKSAIAQLLGGAVMGFGHALFEEVVYADGQILNGDPFQYRLPVAKDLPSFHANVGHGGRGRTRPVRYLKDVSNDDRYGCPAIGNAIYDASGTGPVFTDFTGKDSRRPRQTYMTTGIRPIMLPPFKILNTNSVSDAVRELRASRRQAKI